MGHSTEVIRTFCGILGTQISRKWDFLGAAEEIPRARNQCPLTTFYSSVVSKEIHETYQVAVKSAQMTAIMAMQLALQRFPEEALNIYTDSVYVAQILLPLETGAYIAPG